MAAPHRPLSEQEVLEIFGNIHHKQSLSPHLQYQVISVDQGGSKISPPRLQFDGLYLLCDINDANLPKHLLDYVGESPPATPACCHWHPAKVTSKTNLQLRNCYRYSNEGGNIGDVRGYIWTQIVNGKEDLKYRLFHVYPEKTTTTKVSMKAMASTGSTKNTSVSKTSKPTTRTLANREEARAPAAQPARPQQRNKALSKTSKPTTLVVREEQACAGPAAQPARSQQRNKARVKSSQPSPPSTRPLSEEDVQAVFDSVHHNRKPPPHLKYKVIPVDLQGETKVRISPPRLKYEDGLYVLCDVHDPTTPKHLKALVAKKQPPPTSFRWNTSGKSHAQSSVFVRRHTCAMNERNERVSSYAKSGVMWAELVNGKENMKYRLLHVFPSPSSTNKGVSTITNTVTRNVGTKRASSKASKHAESKHAGDGCEVCGEQSDGDCLMECDGCESRYCHTFCIGLTALPKGDWFCKTCMPRKPPKKRTATGDVNPKGPPKKKSRSAETRGLPPNAIALIPSGRVSPSTVDSEEVSQHIHYKLTLLQKESGNRDDHVGFLIMDSHDATFADVRAAIWEELDPESLPGEGWKFVVPSLGPLGPRQEQSLGSVASFYGKAFENHLGDGTVDKPFALSLVSSPLSPS